MLKVIAAIFILYPLVELAALLYLGRATSVSFVLLVVVLTGILGVIVLRWQGYALVQRARKQMENREIPSLPIMDGFMIFIAAMLLIFPGVIGDVIGFSLLIPPVRRWYIAAISWYLKKRFHIHKRTTVVSTDGSGERTVVVDSEVLDGSAKVIDEQASSRPPNLP